MKNYYNLKVRYIQVYAIQPITKTQKNTISTGQWELLKVCAKH